MSMISGLFSGCTCWFNIRLVDGNIPRRGCEGRQSSKIV